MELKGKIDMLSKDETYFRYITFEKKQQCENPTQLPFKLAVH